MTRLIPTLAGKTRNSGHIHLNTDRTTLNMTGTDGENHIFRIIIAQYSLKIGIMNFKEQGEAAVTKELTQMHTLENFLSVEATKLT